MKICADSSAVECPAHQPGEGGSIPTSALHFSVGQAKPVREFISRTHYSKSCPPSQHYFTAREDGRLVGAAVFRRPSLPSVEKAYGASLELVRLALLDACEKNSESRFVGWALRWLKKNTPTEKVVSFADPRFGHSGKIYLACNFKYLGKERGHGTRRITIDGKEWHPKSAFDAFGCSGAELKKLLPSRAVDIFVCPPKHVYLFSLR